MDGPALTGSRVSYYLAQVTHPQREEQAPYQAECEDIISALNMTFDEACEFKAIWRTAAARLGNGKPGQKAVYDAEKRLHYAGRSLRHERIKAGMPADPSWRVSQGKPPVPWPADQSVEVIFADGKQAPEARRIENWVWDNDAVSSTTIAWWRPA